MLAIIGYLFLATITSALSQIGSARKSLLWDWIGCVPFFASILLCISFANKVISSITLPDLTPEAVIMTWQILGTAILIFLGVVASYLGGYALLTHLPAYVRGRRQKRQNDTTAQ